VSETRFLALATFTLAFVATISAGVQAYVAWRDANNPFALENYRLQVEALQSVYIESSMACAVLNCWDRRRSEDSRSACIKEYEPSLQKVEEGLSRLMFIGHNPQRDEALVLKSFLLSGARSGVLYDATEKSHIRVEDMKVGDAVWKCYSRAFNFVLNSQDAIGLPLLSQQVVERMKGR